jgi:signal transduction histidine kinase
MEKKALLSIILFYLLISASGQNRIIDSLEIILNKNITEDTVRINQLNILANRALLSDPEKAFKSANESCELSLKLRFRKGEAESNRIIASYFYNKKDYIQALKFFEKAAKIFEETGLKRETSLAEWYIGIINYKLNNYESSLDYLDKALIIAEQSGDLELSATCLETTGRVLIDQGNYPEAIETIQKGLKIDEQRGDKKLIANCYVNLGVIYERLENFPEALEYYQKALAIKKEIGNNSAAPYLNIGSVYLHQKDFENALKYFQDALKLGQDSDNKLVIAASMANIGSVYDSLKNSSLAFDYTQKALKVSKLSGQKSIIGEVMIDLGSLYLEQKKYTEALDYTSRGLAIEQEIGMKEMQKNGYEQLSVIYESTKDYKKAYESYKSLKQLNDTLLNKTDIQKMDALKYSLVLDKEKRVHELKIKEKDLIHKLQIEKEKRINYLLLICIISLGTIFIVGLRSYRRKVKTNTLLEEKQLQIEKQKDELFAHQKILQSLNSELQMLNASKDKFFAIIAHDLRGPMGAFMGFSQILAEEYRSMSPDEIKDIAGTMAESSNNLFRLLENLLEWSKMQRGLIDFNPEQFQLLPNVIESVGLITDPARKKSIEIVFNIPENIMVFADKHMFDTVIRNLVSNAIKFTPRGGKIDVSAAVSIESSVEIKIKDSGIGIPDELLGKLFKLNEKTSRSGTDGEPSTGLGLLLCKEFVEKHGGKLIVESQSGFGSIFKFVIPKHS